MWLSLFTVILAIAVGLGFGAVLIESGGESPRRYARKRIRRVRG